MDDIIIEDGPLKATFSPACGMNLISLKFGSIEVIDQSTKNLFDERSAGLGAIIGPHFHRRKEDIIPNLDYALFPKRTKEGTDPFSHGVGRYAPWVATKENNTIKAVLKGSDVWNGVKLSDIEAQDFTMTYTAAAVNESLELELSVVSQTDSLVGIHFYYHVPENKGFVESIVAESKEHQLQFSLEDQADQTFHPHPDRLKGEIALKLKDYTLMTHYESASSENCWQLWRPKTSFVCIEPLSALDPRHPNLTVSSIKIRLSLK